MRTRLVHAHTHHNFAGTGCGCRWWFLGGKVVLLLAPALPFLLCCCVCWFGARGTGRLETENREKIICSLFRVEFQTNTHLVHGCLKNIIVLDSS